MKKQKAFLLLFVCILSFLISPAQIKSWNDNAFQTDFSNIIIDYPNSFQHYIGEELIRNPQSVDYSSLLKIRGSEDCVITKYNSSKRNRYSFQAVMATTEDFETAKNKFQAFYNQLNNMPVRFSHNEASRLQGVYESPTEEKKFTSTIFSASQDDASLKNLKVELLMEYVVTEWKVKLLVYEKEREDDERGDVKE